jgi:hypothetical protein
MGLNSAWSSAGILNNPAAEDSSVLIIKKYSKSPKLVSNPSGEVQ